MKPEREQPIEPRRTLQLSAILVELRKEAVPEAGLPPSDEGQEKTPAPELESVSAGIPPGQTSAPRARPRHQKRPRIRSNISIGEILDRTRQAGFGFIAALLALIAIPFFGLSTPFGLAIAFVGGQMIAGLPHPWLPRRVRDHLVTMETLQWLGERLARWTSGLERIIRPRLTLMIAGPFWTACGAGLLIQGLALALPLPIPGSNWVFIVPIILYGIGLLESDGLLIIVCHIITLVEVALGIWLWKLIERGLVDAWHWVVKLFT
jgi:hypothetical protein